MSTARILLLGAIAGATIFLGLPVGRMRSPAPRLRAALNATAAGILVFLLWDILSHAVEPVEAALTAAALDHTGTWARFSGLAAVLVVGMGAGLLTLVWLNTALSKGSAIAGRQLDPALRLALFIALGIGLHNFSEGLAIGQSAGAGDINLAVLLIVGFGLHNATEGFGIVAPLAAEQNRPSWRFLAAMGTIGGAPTFLGTWLGHSWVNDTVFVAFLALAAGSILYVVVQLVKVGVRMGREDILFGGLFVGFLVGLATDFVLVAAGA